MPKNIHTYRAKLNALWSQMHHTVEYLIRSNGLNWVANNCSEAIEVGTTEFCFHGTFEEIADAVDDLVLKMQREAHNDPNYTF